MYLHSPGDLFAQSVKKSRVVLVRNEDLLDRLSRPRIDIVRTMLDEAMTTLAGETRAIDAWKRIIKPDDIVGIKSNEWRYLPTPQQLEAALRERVMDAGVSKRHIAIDDRGVRENRGFLRATALINVRPLRTHHWAGVGSLIKNYIMFVEEPSAYHPDSCADLASIWKLPLVRGKTRLNILVLFTPLFHGIGPHHFNPKYIWQYRGLLAGFDPVAVDTVGVQILMAKRKQYFGEERPLNPPPKHIVLADTRHKLGTADPQKIDLIRTGWQEDMLI